VTEINIEIQKKNPILPYKWLFWWVFNFRFLREDVKWAKHEVPEFKLCPFSFVCMPHLSIMNVCILLMMPHVGPMIRQYNIYSIQLQKKKFKNKGRRSWEQLLNGTKWLFWWVFNFRFLREDVKWAKHEVPELLFHVQIVTQVFYFLPLKKK
jgi:hypothetical protein